MLDDTYYLHFAMAGTGNETHLVTVGNTKFAIGPTGYDDNGNVTPALADYPRDGKWYNIDIPYAEIRSRATAVFDSPQAYTGNVFAVLSGGKQGTQLQFDNVVFFYRTVATGITAHQPATNPPHKPANPPSTTSVADGCPPWPKGGIYIVPRPVCAGGRDNRPMPTITSLISMHMTHHTVSPRPSRSPCAACPHRAAATLPAADGGRAAASSRSVVIRLETLVRLEPHAGRLEHTIAAVRTVLTAGCHGSGRTAFPGPETKPKARRVLGRRRSY